MGIRTFTAQVEGFPKHAGTKKTRNKIVKLTNAQKPGGNYVQGIRLEVNLDFPLCAGDQVRVQEEDLAENKMKYKIIENITQKCINRMD